MKKLIILAMSLGVMACTRDVVDNAPAPFQNLPETRAGGDGKYDILGSGYGFETSII